MSANQTTCQPTSGPVDALPKELSSRSWANAVRDTGCNPRVPFPIPERYASEAADIARDEAKRLASPPSFFFAQTRALLLASDYFNNHRLKAGAAGGVAAKHRNRIRSAFFGQLMAAFEFCIRDFLAQVVDASDAYDDVVNECKWIDVDKSRMLAQRDVAGSVGALLIHPLLGWHDTDQVNSRYEAFFEHQLLSKDEARDLQRLWIIRHSVAHNSGFVTHHDAYRLQAPTLRNAAIAMNHSFLSDTTEFLRAVVSKLQREQVIGDRVLARWFERKATGVWQTDKLAYTRVRHVVTIVSQRTQPLPKITKGMCSADRRRLAP